MQIHLYILIQIWKEHPRLMKLSTRNALRAKQLEEEKPLSTSAGRIREWRWRICKHVELLRNRRLPIHTGRTEKDNELLNWFIGNKFGHRSEDNCQTRVWNSSSQTVARKNVVNFAFYSLQPWNNDETVTRQNFLAWYERWPQGKIWKLYRMPKK